MMPATTSNSTSVNAFSAESGVGCVDPGIFTFMFT
jgi:hypothetical protein